MKALYFLATKKHTLSQKSSLMFRIAAKIVTLIGLLLTHVLDLPSLVPYSLIPINFWYATIFLINMVNDEEKVIS